MVAFDPWLRSCGRGGGLEDIHGKYCDSDNIHTGKLFSGLVSEADCARGVRPGWLTNIKVAMRPSHC